MRKTFRAQPLTRLFSSQAVTKGFFSRDRNYKTGTYDNTLEEAQVASLISVTSSVNQTSQIDIDYYYLLLILCCFVMPCILLKTSGQSAGYFVFFFDFASENDNQRLQVIVLIMCAQFIHKLSQKVTGLIKKINECDCQCQALPKIKRRAQGGVSE